MFKNKVLLITGGTGSFGNIVCKRFLEHDDINEIRIFSRDEKKQDDMRKKFNSSKLKFFLGDVRDCKSINSAMYNVNYVFHAAALKQVPSCEFYPMEAVKTNILGTDNVISSAIAQKVEKIVCLSTDKAVYPINAMGMSKALMEKVMIAKSRELQGTDTIVCGTRYGNVMASRGSVIPIFTEQVRQGKPITITDPNMTRFMMSLEQAVELVLFAFKNGENGDVFVQKAPAATMELLAKMIAIILGYEDYQTKIIGTRHGEKLYESLLTREEMARAIDLGDYYRIPSDTRDLNYQLYFENGEKSVTQAEEYHSHNTYRLNENELYQMLFDLPEMQKYLGHSRAR